MAKYSVCELLDGFLELQLNSWVWPVHALVSRSQTTILFQLRLHKRWSVWGLMASFLLWKSTGSSDRWNAIMLYKGGINQLTPMSDGKTSEVTAPLISCTWLTLPLYGMIALQRSNFLWTSITKKKPSFVEAELEQNGGLAAQDYARTTTLG